MLKGKIDANSLQLVPIQKTPEELRLERAHQNKAPLESVLNLNDFEAVAKNVMKKDGWAYYSSAADDEITVIEFLHVVP